MQRFVYVPKVEVFVRCDGDGSNRIVDVTEDVIDGSVTRNVDQLSTATVTLQNKFGRYTGGARGSGGPNAVRFRAMDRIIVRMARVGQPHLVFSGYLDETPYFQLYPGPVTIKASCTLKLLQNTYFDPGLPIMTAYFQQFGWIYNPATGMLSDSVGTAGVDQRFGYLDVAGGVGDVMQHVLHDVGNWPNEAIDIQDLPIGFLKAISKAMSYQLSEVQRDDEAMIDRLKKFLGTTGTATGGTTTNTTTNPQTGNISMEQTATLASQAGFKGDALITAVAVARAESSFKTDAMGYNSNGTYDVGLWQINTVHTPGGGGSGGLAAPPHGLGALQNPDDFNVVKASLPANVRTYMVNCQDPAFNAKEAYTIAGNGTTFTPWVTYNNGLHKPYMDAAKVAVDSVLGGAAIAPNATGITGTTVNDPVGTRNSTEPSGKTDKVATSIVRIAIAESQKGIHESGGENQGPEILKYQQTTGAVGQAWCGSFATWVYLQAGLDIRPLYSGGTASVATIMNTARSKGWTASKPIPGDLICWDGPSTEDHVAIVVAVTGNTISFVGGNQSNGVTQGSTTVGALDSLGRAPVYVHTPGIGSAASDAATGAGTDAGAASTETDTVSAALQAGWAILQTQSNDTLLSNLLTGERALANDVSLLQWIGQVCAASGRSFMSKPNGEFFAFYPDYFNYFTNTPYFRVADIELVDFTVYENDTELTTHLFATGPTAFGGHQGPISIQDRINSMVASVESEAFSYFINIDEADPQKARSNTSSFDAYAFLRRYGARPLPKDFDDIQHPVLLWLVAWREFTLQWAKRYSAQCETTFLPELFPGTVIELGGLGGITMYVENVTHTFSRSGGFQTSASLISPATSNTDRWKGLPISGELEPSRYTTGTDFYDTLPNG
jgi:hypothetical protein